MTQPGPLIISTMKNEGPYILEWVAYHRAIGFGDFLIYTNDCEDGTVELLERLTERGIVRHEANKVLRRGPHKSALKAAQIHPMTKAAEWILVSDVDEFLNIKLGDGSVQTLIASLPGDTDAIPVTWRMFTHNGRVDFEDAPMMAQFTEAQKPLEQGGFPDRYVKTLFRGQDRVERFGLHRPIVAEPHIASYTSRAPDGALFDGDMRHSKSKTHFAYEAAQMNHYAVRAVDSYLVKRDRGRANHVGQVLGADYWQKMCLGGSEDLSIQRHMPAFHAALSELMSDPQTARLHTHAVEWHQAKIAELRARPEFAALRAEILSLSAAGDHLRNVTDTPMPLTPVPSVESGTPQAAPPMAPQEPEAMRAPRAAKPAPPPPTGADPSERLQALCAEMHDLLDAVSPAEAASAARRRLSEIERGLFGLTQR